MLFRKDSPLDRLAQRVAGREERSVSVADFPSTWATGKPHPFKPEASLKAYGDNAYLFQAVNKVAQEVARTKFHLQIERDGEIEIIREHQALATLKKPNPTKGGKTTTTGMALKFRTAQHLLLTGEAFWLLDKRLKMSGAPTQIRLLLPGNVRVKPDSSGGISEYVYNTQAGEWKLDPADVVNFKFPNPEDELRGHSPVKSIRYSADNYKQADQLNTNLLKNGAQPAGFLKTSAILTDAQREKMRDVWASRHNGVEMAGKTPFLPFGIDFQPSQQSNRDMQWYEGKQLSRDEMLANWGVGLEIIGQTQGQTRANAEAAFFAFMRFGALFFIELFNDTLTNDFLEAFPHEEGTEFGFSDPVPANMEEKRLNMQAAFTMGAVTPNEVRKEFGMEPSDQAGMDDTYLPIGVLPTGEEPVAPNVPGEGPVVDEDGEEEDAADDE